MTTQDAMRVEPAVSRRPGTSNRAPRKGIGSGRVLFVITLVVLTVIFVAPLLWMLLSSFKTLAGSTHLPPSWIPHPATTSGYQPLLDTSSQTPVIRWFFNSLAAGVLNALLIVATASMAAYALARLQFPGRRLAFAAVVGTLFIPSFLFLIPNYIIVSKLQWLDSLWAIVVPSAGGAFGVFFLRQFFLSIPVEIEEAAMLDGANRWQIFTRVVLPLSKPGLATLLVLSFLTNYNDFLWPVFVLFSPSRLTLPAGLSILQGAYTINYPVIMAGAVIASVPAIVLFILAQRSIIEGVSRSGLKG